MVMLRLRALVALVSYRLAVRTYLDVGNYHEKWVKMSQQSNRHFLYKLFDLKSVKAQYHSHLLRVIPTYFDSFSFTSLIDSASCR